MGNFTTSISVTADDTAECLKSVRGFTKYQASWIDSSPNGDSKVKINNSLTEKPYHINYNVL